jgi:hypothetical protein
MPQNGDVIHRWAQNYAIAILAVPRTKSALSAAIRERASDSKDTSKYWIRVELWI